MAWLLLLAAFTIVISKLIYLDVLGGLAVADIDHRLQAVVASLTLFAPTSFLIGMTSPYLAKLNVRSLGTSGRAVASLDMFNAMGGIIGTFTTGFILFGYVGSRESLVLIIGLLIASSWLLAPRNRWSLRLSISGALLLVAIIPQSTPPSWLSIDTPSAHYRVGDISRPERDVTVLTTGPAGAQSAVYQTGPKDLVFWYTQAMAKLAITEKPDTILILGGGAFTLPEYLGRELPQSQIDVVEIDPELEQIAKKHFRYDPPQNVTTIAKDARVYVNQTDKQYDMILVDAYGDTEMPFSLLTSNFTAELAEVLRPNGRVVINAIVGEIGPCREVLATIDAAYRQQFSQAVYTNQSGQPERRANYILVYANQEVGYASYETLPRFDQAVFTDNFAPVERLQLDCKRV